jgi:hypothetical protein
LSAECKKIAGISDKDSIFMRIEALRVYLEKQLGQEDFIKAYQLLAVSEKFFYLLTIIVYQK